MPIQIGNRNFLQSNIRSVPAFALTPIPFLGERKVGGYTRAGLEERLRANYGAGRNEYSPNAFEAIKSLAANEGQIFAPDPKWISEKQDCYTYGGQCGPGKDREPCEKTRCNTIKVLYLQDYLAAIFTSRSVESD